MKHTLALLCVCLLVTVSADAQLFRSSCLNPDQNSAYSASPFLTDKTNWREDVSRRTMYSSTWEHEDGRVIIECSKKPIYYYAAYRQLQRIVITPEKENGAWTASHQVFPVALNDDGSFELASNTQREISFSNHELLNGQIANGSLTQKNEKTFVVKDIITGVDKEFIFSENGMKYQYLLHAPLDVAGDDMVITQELSIPEGADIVCDKQRGYSKDEMWSGNLLIVNEDNNVLGTIHGAICYDANGRYSLGRYAWKMKDDTHVTLSMYVESSWLNDANTTYPVTLDPLVTGPVAAFGDNFIPSCFIPNYSADSIYVTIPGEITVTAFYVTSSFYADPFAPAVKGDGSMYFSTTCDSTGTFEVQGDQENVAGIAFLDHFDLRVPLMCCFEPQCTDLSFYLTMHIGRYTPEGDCNSTYIYYNTVTDWPFTAYIEGHTVETYGAKWSVTNTAICSNKCEFEGTARVKYGVPPYTLTHPWMDGSVVVEEPTPCDITGKSVDLTMHWPGCPQYCPDPFSMDVPPPIVTDACGNVAEGMPTENLNIKPAPSIDDPSPITVCSDVPSSLTFVSCAPQSVIQWAGNGESGSGVVPLNLHNPSSGIFNYYYDVHADWNGCHSDTLELTIGVLPAPQAEFHFAPDPVMLNIPAFFVDDTEYTFGNIVAWNWTLDGENPQYGDLTEYTMSTMNDHIACLVVKSDLGCVDTLCKNVPVITARIIAPNVFTPNGDDLNETLEFKYLDFFPVNHLDVWNRWGNIVYTAENYKNNWDGKDLSAGTYYYILDVKYLGKISGYFEILH